MTVEIQFYTDVLCVWAYIGQRRVDELLQHHQGQVNIEPHFMSVFGNVSKKMFDGWSHRGGIAAYAAHVAEVSKRFPEIVVHEHCWTSTQPTSSMPCHLVLNAIRVLESNQKVSSGTTWKATQSARKWFFEKGQDISKMASLMSLLDELHISAAEVQDTLNSGLAHASLMQDYDGAKDQYVKMSPTLIFNSGRQRLQGNVGYRLIESSVKELIDADVKAEWASWC